MTDKNPLLDTAMPVTARGAQKAQPADELPEIIERALSLRTTHPQETGDV